MDLTSRAAVVVLFAVGLVLGILTSFLVPVRLAGGVEGLSIVIALAGTVLLGLLGGWGTDRVLGAAIPGIGWFVAVGAVNVYLPGGDVIVPGSLPIDPGVPYVGYGFLVAGVAGTIAAATLTSRRLKSVVTRTHSDGARPH